MNAIPEGKLLQAKLEFDEDSFQPAIITRLDNEKENKDDDDDIMLEQKNLVEKVSNEYPLNLWIILNGKVLWKTINLKHMKTLSFVHNVPELVNLNLCVLEI